MNKSRAAPHLATRETTLTPKLTPFIVNVIVAVIAVGEDTSDHAQGSQCETLSLHVESGKDTDTE